MTMIDLCETLCQSKRTPSVWFQKSKMDDEHQCAEESHILLSVRIILKVVVHVARTAVTIAVHGGALPLAHSMLIYYVLLGSKSVPRRDFTKVPCISDTLVRMNVPVDDEASARKMLGHSDWFDDL